MKNSSEIVPQSSKNVNLRNNRRKYGKSPKIRQPGSQIQVEEGNFSRVHNSILENLCGIDMGFSASE